MVWRETSTIYPGLKVRYPAGDVKQKEFELKTERSLEIADSFVGSWINDKTTLDDERNGN